MSPKRESVERLGAKALLVIRTNQVIHSKEKRRCRILLVFW